MPKPCMTDRWGKGSCVPNPEKTANTRETEDKLKKLIAERDKLDTLLQGNNNELTVVKLAPRNIFEQK
jgi:hypothetical protein